MNNTNLLANYNKEAKLLLDNAFKQGLISKKKYEEEDSKLFESWARRGNYYETVFKHYYFRNAGPAWSTVEKQVQEERQAALKKFRSDRAKQAMKSRVRNSVGQFRRKGASQMYSSPIGPGNYKGKSPATPTPPRVFKQSYTPISIGSGGSYNPDGSAATAITVLDVHASNSQPSRNKDDGRTLTVVEDYNIPNVGPTGEWEDMVMELNNYTRPQLMQKYIDKVGELTACKREYEKCKREVNQVKLELSSAVNTIRLFRTRLPVDATTDLVEALDQFQNAFYDQYVDWSPL